MAYFHVEQESGSGRAEEGGGSVKREEGRERGVL